MRFGGITTKPLPSLLAISCMLTLGWIGLHAAAESTGKVNLIPPGIDHESNIPLPKSAIPAIESIDLSKSSAKNSSPAKRPSIAPKVTPTPPAQAPNSSVAKRPTPAKAPRIASRPETPAADDLALALDAPANERSYEPKWQRPTKTDTATVDDNEAPAGDAPEVSPANPPAESASPLKMPVLAAPANEPADKQPAKQAETKDAKPEPFSKPDDAKELDADEEPQPEEEVKKPEPKPLKPLTRNQLYLRNKMRKVLSYYFRQMLNSREHDSWEVMHGMLAYELESQVRQNHPRGKSITAIGWLCYNNSCDRKQLMRLNDEGKIRALYGVGLQGHMGQFLAMLAQCNVDPKYPIRVEGKEFTINDLIESEKETCYADTELTFKLIGLMHYLPSDSTWMNDRGEQWTIERLIDEELKQPIRGAACGGTHRLAGLSLAARKRELRDEPVDGSFARAAEYTQKYADYAYRLQNSDGSFSTEWFRGKGAERDINRRARTSGHLLEWLVYHAKDEQLDDYRLVRGVNYVTNLLYSNSDNEWEIGPKCHALHALYLYNKRKFKPYDEQQIAKNKNEKTARRSSNSRSSQSTSKSNQRYGHR